MSHGITETDGLVLVQQPAWHGLGTIVESAPTPLEAAKIAGLEWECEQRALQSVQITPDGPITSPITSHVVNVRSDNQQQLGVVGKDWKPVQPVELAKFCTDLAEGQDVVRVESAGSVFGGKKIWFLLRGQSFSVKGFDDVVEPYLLATTGFDGSIGIMFRSTSIRVVCRNTLEMSLGAKAGNVDLRFPHTGDLAGKLDEAKKVIGLFGKQAETFRAKVDAMAAKAMGRESLQRFFLGVYTSAFGAFDLEPTTEGGVKLKEKAEKTIGEFSQQWDVETKISGSTLWSALNAATGVLQRNAKPNSKLFGAASERTNIAARVAIGEL